MKISLIQFKSELGEVEKNFATAERLLELAKGSDAAILPELWSTGYYPKPAEKFADPKGERTKNFISALSKKFGLNIIAGSVIVEDSGKIFNRTLVSNRRGEIIAAYDKVHLFSFANEGEVFSAGDRVVTFELDGVTCGVAICYDLRFPEIIRRLTLQGAKIIFIPAAWSLRRLEPRRILTKARAIENQNFVVFVNSSGKSEIVNPLGEVVAETGTGEEVLTAEIDLSFREKVIGTMNLLADRNIFVDTL